MHVSTLKPVSWLAVNLHQLFSDGAAVNTQSRSLVTHTDHIAAVHRHLGTNFSAAQQFYQ